MKTIVVAYDKKYGIGADNHLLWHHDLPSDLRHFKDVTMGGAIIMGRKTFNSIGRALPGRQNIVISRDMEPVEDVTVAASLEAAYAAVEPNRETYVIGGGQIYALAMDAADCILATEVDATFDNATVFFPRINPDEWIETDRVHHEKDERNLYDYDFVTYRRR